MSSAVDWYFSPSSKYWVLLGHAILLSLSDMPSASSSRTKLFLSGTLVHLICRLNLMPGYEARQYMASTFAMYSVLPQVMHYFTFQNTDEENLSNLIRGSVDIAVFITAVLTGLAVQMVWSYGTFALVVSVSSVASTVTLLLFVPSKSLGFCGSQYAARTLRWLLFQLVGYTPK